MARAASTKSRSRNAEDFAADEAGVADPGADAEEEDDIEEASFPYEGDGGDEEDEEGDGGLGVGGAHDDVTDEAAAVAGDEAHNDCR